jgi:6-phosphogluconate dehydrogenase
MVHNGMKYGIMAAYAEGLNILKKANIGHGQAVASAEVTPLRDPRFYRYDFDTAAVAEMWRRGSVVGSWLLDLTAHALLKQPDLAGFSGRGVGLRRGSLDGGGRRGRGRARSRADHALYERFSSRREADYADKMLSAMRKEFGGHEELPTGE